MTTSYSVTRDQILTQALRRIGVIGETQTPTTQQINTASDALNELIKFWQAKGVTLWKVREVVLPLVAGVRQYPIGPTAGYIYSIPVTNGGSGYDNTSTLTISSPGTFSGYPGSTAVASLQITGGAVTGVTIVSGGGGYTSAPTLTLGGAGVGATFGSPVIIGLTTTRPLRVLEQNNYIRNLTSTNDTPISLLGRDEYNSYGQKSSLGIPNSIFYDPQLGNGQLYTYPVPVSSGNYELHLVVQVPFEDMNTSTDTPDFPQEWYMGLVYAVARELVLIYGVDEATERRIEMKYQEYSTTLFDFSVEEASAYFTYDTRGR